MNIFKKASKLLDETADALSDSKKEMDERKKLSQEQHKETKDRIDSIRKSIQNTKR